ncbi:MAG: TolC family protein [Bacteroidetes bacterium]|nr:TolC family protein [Bacteroidota bacterium]
MKRFSLFICLSICVNYISAQTITEIGKDTLRISLKDIETDFLNNNLDLIAQRYSIDSARASVITAKLYDNPEIDFSNALYNPSDHSFFNSERTFQISQLIQLAGKRNKSINFASAGVEVAQNQFYDLLRTLRFVLRSDFFNIYYLQQSSKVYQVEISSLQKIVDAFKREVEKGYIAPADLLRVQSQLYTLQAEYDNLQTNITQIQSEVKSMIMANPASYIEPVFNESISDKQTILESNYQSLVDTALANRPDIKAIQSGIAQNMLNVSLQKALAVPDISVFAGYDRLGGYIRNYSSIGISMPIPIFNRNQGNIKNARIQEDASKTILESETEKVKNEVTANYITALRSEKLLSGFDPGFEENMRKLIEQVTINFKKKNISILEFLDHYDAYKQNILQLNQLRFNNKNALEQLNFSTGKIIFNQQ